MANFCFNCQRYQSLATQCIDHLATVQEQADRMTFAGGAHDEDLANEPIQKAPSCCCSHVPVLLPISASLPLRVGERHVQRFVSEPDADCVYRHTFFMQIIGD